MFFRNSAIQGQKKHSEHASRSIVHVDKSIFQRHFANKLCGFSIRKSPTSGQLWHTPTKKEKERRGEKKKKKRNKLPDSKDNNLTMFFQLSSLWLQRQKRTSRAWCTAISRPLTECLMSAQRVKRPNPLQMGKIFFLWPKKVFIAAQILSFAFV